LRPCSLPLSLQPFTRPPQPAEIGVEPDRLRMPPLLPPEQVPRAPQLEVAQRDAVARSEIGVVLEHLQALLGLRIHLIGDEQVAGGAPVAPPDAPAQLIQLRQPELVRPRSE